MNWHLIGSQVLSALIAGVVAAGPVGLAAKFYLDRSLKKHDASAAERLEKLKNELNQRRDSRQARITQSVYANQKTFESEFQAINDVYRALDRLAMTLVESVIILKSQRYESEEQKQNELTQAMKEGGEAQAKIFDLLREHSLHLSLQVSNAVFTCVKTITTTLPLMFADNNPTSVEALENIQQCFDACGPSTQAASFALRDRLKELQRVPD